MHYIPAPPGFAVIRSYATEVEDAVEYHSLHWDPLVMYAYVDSEDRPASVYPVLGAEDWQVELLDAIEGAFTWYALPEDLIQQTVHDAMDKHHRKTCATEPTCQTLLVHDYRQGHVVVDHTQECMERQRARRREEIQRRIEAARTDSAD